MYEKNSWRNKPEKKKKDVTDIDVTNVPPIKDNSFYNDAESNALTDPGFYKDVSNTTPVLPGMPKREATPSELGEQVIVEWLYNVGEISKEQAEEERNAFAKRFSNAGAQNNATSNTTDTTSIGNTMQPQSNKPSLWNMSYEDLHPEYQFVGDLATRRLPNIQYNPNEVSFYTGNGMVNVDLDHVAYNARVRANSNAQNNRYRNLGVQLQYLENYDATPIEVYNPITIPSTNTYLDLSEFDDEGRDWNNQINRSIPPLTENELLDLVLENEETTKKEEETLVLLNPDGTERSVNSFDDLADFAGNIPIAGWWVQGEMEAVTEQGRAYAQARLEGDDHATATQKAELARQEAFTKYFVNESFKLILKSFPFAIDAVEYLDGIYITDALEVLSTSENKEEAIWEVFKLVYNYVVDKL